jgi:FixJ family two-component response regulator
MSSPERSGTACLITDVNMPGMSGPELHQQLIDAGEHIPTIFVTAFPDEAVRKRAVREGIDCYLTKPFLEEELLGCVRSALARDARPQF